MHALVNNSNAIIKRHDFGNSEIPQLATEKGLRWIPVAAKPVFDSGSQKLVETVGVLEVTYQVVDLTNVEVSAQLAIDIPAAIAKTYTDVDAIYAVAIGNRATEYKAAEDAARAYKAAGYTGAVSEFISSYATHNITGQQQTNQWAADAIIARADALLTAQASMRSQRFASQDAMRQATTSAQLAIAVAAWDTFVAGIKTALGV